MLACNPAPNEPPVPPPEDNIPYLVVGVVIVIVAAVGIGWKVLG